MIYIIYPTSMTAIFYPTFYYAYSKMNTRTGLHVSQYNIKIP